MSHEQGWDSVRADGQMAQDAQRDADRRQEEAADRAEIEEMMTGPAHCARCASLTREEILSAAAVSDVAADAEYLRHEPGCSRGEQWKLWQLAPAR